MKELSRLGLGINTKKSEVITVEQEEILWSKGLLGESNPQQLLDTLLFLFGLHFALRAAQEHRNLRFGMNTQLSVKYDLEGKKYLQYIEDVSKTNQGGLDYRKVSPKMTRAYENSNPLRCPVRLYEKYIALRPKNGTVDAFYLRPKKMPCSDVWYCDSPVGIHTIQSTVKRLCQSAGIIGNFSNHSLRATAATRLYQAGVDEQLITEKTGHRSNAVRAYKRTSDAQQASMISVTSLLSIVIPRSYILNEFVASSFLAIAIHRFYKLIMLYYEGEDNFLNEMKNEKIQLNRPPFARCCFMCPKINVTRYCTLIDLLLCFGEFRVVPNL
ncbi:hypothetical protein LOTGIDRAFT_161138 [Lottia gigantea]|uniref:ZMYM2-like/QRICH1 C-terminal domain-containing protein n=1 Tax=Lottia gigantea TaxID=225164 RepID=V3ZSM6_LOTGI|nr:hypothetical protein LOTGIDRAFT_161138 [Lottia gigantea]ESO94448.1 hypothetical protein LOTGIDRAFT_161138 [Lottia gigantea]